jgi:hypothetical protein
MISPLGDGSSMIKLANPAGLEGLLNLDREGVDIRPTLLRVITDQYLQTAVHTPDEERQFTELALRLIDETEIATRAAVATRLAHHASAPHPIILRLARDVLDVAEPILLYSPCLTQADLDAIAAEGGAPYAEIVARRRPPEQAGKQAAAATCSEPEPPAPQRAENFDKPIPGSNPMAGTQPDGLCETFFTAGPEERKLILMMLDCAIAVPTSPPSLLARTDVWRLESAALQHNTEMVVGDLERALGVSRRLARRIVQDETGEPIVVAARALALPNDVLQRILLFMNPRVGQSVERVHKLAELAEEITLDGARRLVEIWREAEPIEAKPASHQAHWQETVQRARQALSEISFRQSARTEPPSRPAPYRASGTETR